MVRGVAAILGGVATLPMVLNAGFALCSSDGTTIYVTHRDPVVVAVVPLLVYLAVGSYAVLASR